LTNLVKSISHKVVDNGGIVRSIQNHGIRQLPHRFKAKYADREGNRYYEHGRFFSIFYDSNPIVQKEVESILKLDEQVLRNTHLKVRNKMSYVNIAKEEKNPYIKKVLEMQQEAEEEQALKQEEGN
jgi:small subunit ribosomal protein S6